MSSNEWKQSVPKIDFVAYALLQKVFQGDQGKLGLARHCASVAIAASDRYVPPERELKRPPLPPEFSPLASMDGNE